MSVALDHLERERSACSDHFRHNMATQIDDFWNLGKYAQTTTTSADVTSNMAWM